MPSPMKESGLGDMFDPAEMAKRALKQRQNNIKAARTKPTAPKMRPETAKPDKFIIEKTQRPDLFLQIKDAEESIKALEGNISEVENEIKAEEEELIHLAKADKIKAEGKILVLKQELIEYQNELADWNKKKEIIEANPIATEEEIAATTREARRGHELDGYDIPKYEPEKPPKFSQRDDSTEYEQIDGSWSKEKPVTSDEIKDQSGEILESPTKIPFEGLKMSIPRAEGRVTDVEIPKIERSVEPETTQNYNESLPVISEEKSWIPASLRKWGKRLLLGLALFGGGRALNQQTNITGKIGAELNQIDQSINDFGARYDEGIKTTVESSPMIQQTRKDQEQARLAQTEKELAEQETVSEQTVEEIPKMTEQVRKESSAQKTLQELPGRIQRTKKRMDQDYNNYTSDDKEKATSW